MTLGPYREPICAFPPPRMSIATCNPGFAVELLFAMWVFPRVTQLPWLIHRAADWLLMISVVTPHEPIFTNELLPTSIPKPPLELNVPLVFMRTSDLCPLDSPSPALPLLVQVSRTTPRW